MQLAWKEEKRNAQKRKKGLGIREKQDSPAKAKSHIAGWNSGPPGPSTPKTWRTKRFSTMPHPKSKRPGQITMVPKSGGGKGGTKRGSDREKKGEKALRADRKGGHKILKNVGLRKGPGGTQNKQGNAGKQEKKKAKINMSYFPGKGNHAANKNEGGPTRKKKAQDRNTPWNIQGQEEKGDSANRRGREKSRS